MRQGGMVVDAAKSESTAAAGGVDSTASAEKDVEEQLAQLDLQYESDLATLKARYEEQRQRLKLCL
jgi:hypothetical protein